MAEINNGGIDPTNNEDDSLLDEFDEQTDEEMEEAGDDPAKLKELIKARTATRQKLYARLKSKEADYKALKGEGGKEGKSSKQQGGKTIELGYGEKGFLVANGIKGSDEFQLVQDIMKESGKSLDDVLESKYFKAELKSMREEKATYEATPKSGSARGGQSARNSVEFWINKGELPPADQVELRRSVVREKTRLASTHNKFGGN